MSGFEIAGVVLGAFPIALHLLDDYRKLAVRANLWRKIKLEHAKCRNDVEFQRVALSSNLRQLILPLLVDDNKANRLLLEPGGESWKDPAIDGLLRDRLGHTYDLYLDYIRGMGDVMVELNKELCMDSTAVQERLSTSSSQATVATSLRNAATNKAKFQLYRIRFNNGEAKRKEMLGKLQEYNEKLEKLLSTSDRDAQLSQQRAAVQYKTSIDAALCNFWTQATRVFQVLAAAWNCTCGQDRHITKLLLQHRTDKKSDFDVLFSAKEPSGWRIQHSRICGENAVTVAQSTAQNPATPASKSNTNTNVTLPLRQPGHRKTPATNLKSSMRTRSKAISTTSAQSSVVSSSVTISAIRTDSPSSASYSGPTSVSLTLDIPPILSLCLSVKQPGPRLASAAKPTCYGYLTATDGDDPSHSCAQAPQKFYLHTVWQQQIPSLTILTFDQIITTGVSRKQRYLLALTLASSFLQFLDTPWLPVSWRRSDIVFLVHSHQTNYSEQLQPYLKRDISLIPLSSSHPQAFTDTSPGFLGTPFTENLPPFPGSSTTTLTNFKTTSMIHLNSSLDRLGIILLELCFGQRLESQYNKMPLPSGGGTSRAKLTEEGERFFDLCVAKSWLYEVEEEAGPAYFEAVAWCLGSASSDKWRVDMLKNVVEPLVRSADRVDGVFK
ncbi:hypothetical protein QBC37DRAFT_464729 [Rhypophila decipiens]|uniref:DUF7580 domain-containing protein n=1 Tax=Rhypophila decipiens TaxID=261697 RepID=A0AAN7B6T5_9PEZI|nr:hypothetical protein QBC37DRAFT_464729 [Rhypophila decipiens]